MNYRWYHSNRPAFLFAFDDRIVCSVALSFVQETQGPHPSRHLPIVLISVIVVQDCKSVNAYPRARAASSTAVTNRVKRVEGGLIGHVGAFDAVEGDRRGEGRDVGEEGGDIDAVEVELEDRD